MTFYQLVDLQRCPVRGMLGALELDGPLPEAIPTRAALIGRFHHRAMELAATASSTTELDARIEAEIAKLQSTINHYPQMRMVGSASGWDEVNRSAALAMRIFSTRGPGGDVRARSIEKDLRSKNGQLVGRPDYFSVTADTALLREYKSGRIWDAGGKPVSAHMDQLKFYSVLIFDNYDVAHIEARLEALSGDVYETEIDRQGAAEYEAHVADLIAGINGAVGTKRDIGVLARPSKEACRSCDGRIICVSFKREQDRLDLEGEQLLIEGLVTQVVRSANGAVTDITIVDEYRKSTVTLAVPTEAAMGVEVHGKYVFMNVRRHGTSFAWGRTSRVLSCE